MPTDIPHEPRLCHGEDDCDCVCDPCWTTHKEFPIYDGFGKRT